jgi:hypothetical protein
MYGNDVGDEFGYSLNLSADGDILAIGSPEGRAGYVKVFALMSKELTDDTKTWNPIGQEIVDIFENGDFGRSVSLSDDGRILVVGNPSRDGGEWCECCSCFSMKKLGLVRVYHIDEFDEDEFYGSNWI